MKAAITIIGTSGCVYMEIWNVPLARPAFYDNVIDVMRRSRESSMPAGDGHVNQLATWRHRDRAREGTGPLFSASVALEAGHSGDRRGAPATSVPWTWTGFPPHFEKKLTARKSVIE